MTYDLIIRNGHVYDPGGGIDYTGDIAVSGKRIASHQINPEDQAAREIAAEGCWVLPGLIDVHTHCNWLGNYIGMPTDIAGIPGGITATIDAGSTGVSNYRSLLRYLDTCETKTKIMLHASASGQIMSTQFAENIDPSVWNLSLFEKAFAEYGDRIVGLKIRASRNVLGGFGTKPIKELVKIAQYLDTRVVVHATDPVVPMGELAGLLRPGDVLCHIYHGAGHTIFQGENIDPGILEARERGVLFDIAQGKGNFSLTVAQMAIERGVIPHTVSTDLNIENWNNPLDFSLATTMSKHLALGMGFEDVIRCVTSNAAVHMGMEGELGTLKEGTCADITILRKKDKKLTFCDIHGNSIPGGFILVPMATIIDGRVLYCSPETLG